MSHEVEIVDKKKFDNAMKIFIEVTICGETCGYPELDGEKHRIDFDMDYERYRDNKKVKNDAAAWAKKVVNKRIEECEPSKDPVGTKLEI